jgi:hypothetical protein
MNRTKNELLLECIKQFEHIEDVLGFNRLSTTKSLIREIEQALRIHDVSGMCSGCDWIDIDYKVRKCVKCGKTEQFD